MFQSSDELPVNADLQLLIQGCKLEINFREGIRVINIGIYIVLCGSQYADTHDTGSIL
jgi:hypothetical protein